MRMQLWKRALGERRRARITYHIPPEEAEANRRFLNWVRAALGLEPLRDYADRKASKAPANAGAIVSKP